MCLYGFNLNDRWSREDIGYRAGFVSIAQLPLIFLLAGKNNIVGYLTGVSHERLNWLHRWCARCLFLTVTIHMGYFFADWAPYNYITIQLKENNIVQRGFVAWVVLLWIVVSSVSPLRRWCYELFVVQHLASFAVLIAFIYIHTPEEVHVYIWIPVGLFFFDRVIRALRTVYTNVSFFHPKQRKGGQMSGFWACKAEFTPLPHDTTRVVIQNPPITWTPGQHIFLSCHSIVPLQSHPFTIASIPEDGRMEFIIKAEKGGTTRFHKYAKKLDGLPDSTEKRRTRTVAIEGPYGTLRPLRQFDSVVLLAGSTGVTFTMPLLRDLVQGWKENENLGAGSVSLFGKPKGAVTRHIRFVWVVKSRGQLGWFAQQLSTISAEVETLQGDQKHFKLEMTVYVTCDDAFTEEHNSLLTSVSLREPEHGTVEFRSRTPSPNEKDNRLKVDDVKVTATDRTSSGQGRQTCGPNGTCCCRTTVENESEDDIAPCCCCGDSSRQRPLSTNSSSGSDSTKKLLVHPSVSVVCGRPSPKNVIRKSLEQALGESAVVVCGPQGLVADVKRDVCALSDERAVHKGTGAQGVYLHTESFSY
jgi:predicted ferric reductase